MLEKQSDRSLAECCVVHIHLFHKTYPKLFDVIQAALVFTSCFYEGSRLLPLDRR